MKGSGVRVPASASQNGLKGNRLGNTSRRCERLSVRRARVVAQPLATYVAERHACRNCAKDARFAWLPLEVTDDSDHRRGAPLKYKPASGFSGGEQFCAEHVTQRLKEFVEEKQLYFTTIRPPVGSLDGYLN